MYTATLKNMEVVAINNSFNNILEREMDINVWNSLSEIVLVLENRIQTYEKVKFKLLQKFVEKNDDGKIKTVVIDGNEQYKFKSDQDKLDYRKALTDLLQQEVQLQFPVKLQFKDLLQQKILINGKDMINIKSFFRSLKD